MTDVDLSMPEAQVQTDRAVVRPIDLRPRRSSVVYEGAALDAESLRLAEVAAQSLELGLRRIEIVDRRLDGGTGTRGLGLVIDQVATAWQDSGLDIVAGDRSRRSKADATVEAWDHVAVRTPGWGRRPRIVLCDPVAGRTVRSAPVSGAMRRGFAAQFSGRFPVVTGSPTSRDHIVSALGRAPSRVVIVPRGTDGRFCPGQRRARQPFVVAAHRLVPEARVDLLAELLIDARRFVPELHAVIVGDGPERSRVEDVIEHAGAGDWLQLTDAVTDDELIAMYRRAWVVASTSGRTGWDSTFPDARACGAPVVAWDTPDNKHTVVDELSGLVADSNHGFVAALVRVLTDEVLRERLSRGAETHAASQSWQRCASDVLSTLLSEALLRR